MNRTRILALLRRSGSRANVEGMARFGIRSTNVFGVSTPELRAIARRIGRDHRLALQLWATGILDARALAAMLDVPEEVTPGQMESWAADFDNWATCDGCCQDLFSWTPWAHSKAIEWSRREPEFVKRAAFALIAKLAFHDKDSGDDRFLHYLRIIERESTDPRLYVRKGVNWALREIGKRSLRLNRAAIRTARRIRRMDTPSARWIAADALRELLGSAVRERLRRKSRPRRTKRL